MSFLLNKLREEYVSKCSIFPVILRHDWAREGRYKHPMRHMWVIGEYKLLQKAESICTFGQRQFRPWW